MLRMVYPLLLFLIITLKACNMCVQLDLFSGVSLQEPLEVLAESEFQEMVKHADIADVVVSYNPCPNCRYYGLCDTDDCAMKGFKLDSNKGTRFYSSQYGF